MYVANRSTGKRRAPPRRVRSISGLKSSDLHPDPDDFWNLTWTSLSTDISISLVKFSWNQQLYVRLLTDEQGNKKSIKDRNLGEGQRWYSWIYFGARLSSVVSICLGFGSNPVTGSISLQFAKFPWIIDWEFRTWTFKIQYNWWIVRYFKIHNIWILDLCHGHRYVTLTFDPWPWKHVQFPTTVSISVIFVQINLAVDELWSSHHFGRYKRNYTYEKCSISQW